MGVSWSYGEGDLLTWERGFSWRGNRSYRPCGHLLSWSASLTCALLEGKGRKLLTHHHWASSIFAGRKLLATIPFWGIENWGHGSLHLKFEGLLVGTGSEHCDFGADSPIIFQSGIY